MSAKDFMDFCDNDLSSLLTVVIPAKNEAGGLEQIGADLRALRCRVLIVDDGSVDRTREIAESFDFTVISHPYSKGNGAAIKTGLRAVETEYVALMDGDGQHSVDDLKQLFQAMQEDSLDLIVGARVASGQASRWRALANKIYNRLSSFMVGKKVLDLTSGQRIFRTKLIKPLIWLLPNAFSYPTTSSMAFYRLGYSVGYRKIDVTERIGNSHINLFKDGFRFLLIIMKIGTLHSPFKIFVPISALLFLLGLLRYLYTFWTSGLFTNMSALMFTASVLVFLMGVLSEQISMLVFSRIEATERKTRDQ